MGQREPDDEPKGTRRWAKENRRTGQREPDDGPRGKDTTKELQGPQRRDRFKGTMKDA
ncbi:hypothetical protein K503DRAFT_770322 [Rhizopogon vinicolor AM-OR11-026]|uniref:Uncharacterized protein n=1 Tax=Rhizopogon vinicolor AM-OR11-026 TaxID=1314800 RepID=A0A1B7N1A5_9AGAM|nr:hypothetical protein K503DRAFT_770322 [Rhizopogon vinicolor AM-OR11-026]